MTTYNVKRTTDASDLTVYNICLGDIELHTEYSRNSANAVKERLEGGEKLSSILSDFFDKQKRAFHSEIEALKCSQEEWVQVEAQLKKTIVQLRATIETLESQKPLIQHRLSSMSSFTLAEVRELTAYCGLFIKHGFQRHWDVNEYLDKTNGWGNFPTIRSLNTHANGYTVNGILKRYYAIVCEILEIGSDNGTPLISSDHY